MSEGTAALSESRTPARAMARYFRVLGDPTRLLILSALLERERDVTELIEITGAPQSRVSNHLACLKWCGFATAQRRGRRIVYRVADLRLRSLLASALELSSEHSDHLASCTRIGPDWV